MRFKFVFYSKKINNSKTNKKIQTMKDTTIFLMLLLLKMQVISLLQYNAIFLRLESLKE